MRKERENTEKKIAALVDSLAELDTGSAKGHVAKRIEELNREYENINERIHELEGLTSQHALSDIEFDVLRQLLSAFKNSIDDMSVEQKRAAIRTIVRRVIWDGHNAHVVLFGADEEEIELPDLSDRMGNVQKEVEDDSLEAYLDVDYDDEGSEQENNGNSVSESGCKARLGGHSK